MGAEYAHHMIQQYKYVNIWTLKALTAALLYSIVECSVPGLVRSNRDGCEVKRSVAASNLLERGTVAGVASKEETMVRAQNRPAAP